MDQSAQPVDQPTACCMMGPIVLQSEVGVAELWPVPSVDRGETHAGHADAGRGFARVAVGLASLLAYVVLEWLSDLHESRGIPVTPWNPGLGLLFGIMVLHGVRYAVVLAVGYVIADQLMIDERLSPAKIALIAVIVGMGYGLAAFAARRWVPVDRGLERLRDVAVLLGAGLLGTTLVCALIAMVLLGGGHWRLADLPTTLLPLFIGDAIGIAIFAPIVLRLARRLRQTGLYLSVVPSADLVAVAVVIIVMLATMHLRLGAEAMRYIFVLFAPIVLAATRHGLDGACFSLAVAQFGLILILNAAGQDARAFTEVQAEMLVLTLTGLIVGVVVSERAALAAEARQATARLKALQLESEQAARISLAGGMSSVLAHEINQPITAARALARSAQHLISGDHADLPRAARNLESSISQIDLAANIVSRMRDFLRRGRPHISTIDIKELLSTAASLARAEALLPSMVVHLTLTEDMPPLFADRTQLGQVLLNLIRNAGEALQMAQVAEGRIELGAARGTDPESIEFYVVDNGPGVPAEQKDSLFEPIRTTKQDGLGLGLAISAFVVQNHRGRIWLAASRPGRTEFRFSVPCDAGEGA